jgi:hypothetical protein
VLRGGHRDRQPRDIRPAKVNGSFVPM